jgi:hypothetical protein
MKYQFLAISLALGLMGGCSTKATMYEGVQFLAPPEDISSAWMGPEGGLYLVPEKGVVIERAVDGQGREIPVVPSGAYLALNASELNGASEVRFLIERRWRRLALKAFDTSQ